MGSSRRSLKRSLLISAFLTLGLFSVATVAQGTQPSSSADGGDTDPAPTVVTSVVNGAASTTTSRNAQTTSSSPRNQRSSSTTTAQSSTTTTSASPSSLPALSSSTSSTSESILTGLPTLSKTVDNTVPTYPPPSPPPVGNAPFMNRSTMPDGTVFIAVGAILGAFGAAVLIWRGIVACLLHRSVERATMAQHAANDKAAFPAPPAPFYKTSERDSTPSVAANGAPLGRGQRRTNRGPTPSGTPSQTNLFFSPTAAGGVGGGASSRDSRFLPSGFYASGAAPGHAHGNSISLSTLRPGSRGRPSPPDSPSMTPQRNSYNQPRNYSVPHHAPSERAPSAYLEDLLDDNPTAFPPQAPGAHHQRHYSGSPSGRY